MSKGYTGGGNIYSWVLRGPTIGPDPMFKLILSGSQDLTIGIQIGLSFYEESHLD